MPRSKITYITTPIYYVNDKPHIGHAYTTLACDVLARFWRLDGHEVLFLTGTDEHGQKVARSAEQAGLAPQDFCDQVSANFRHLAKAMNFSHDDFIRTTEERHIRATQALWTELKARGEIYLGSYSGWYAIRDEAYYGEDELTKGPDGKYIAPSGAPVEWVEEPSYFFRLSAWGEKLLAFYEANPDFILPPSRRNEVVSFVKSGLKDLSVSRTTFKWGVPVPDDPQHVIYVWLDALTNYITAAGYPDTANPKYEKFWPASLHMVGKDIIRFHAVYWPAMLMAAGIELPKRIFAHGWWKNEGQKMSKSLGNVIDPLDLVSTYGLDQTRYFLMREVPFGEDGDFTQTGLVRRINSDLANDFGNLCQRVLSMINRNCDGKIPKPQAFTQADDALLADSFLLLADLRKYYQRQEIHLALQRQWEVVGAANRYVDREAPWVLKKSNPARMGTVLFVLAEVIRRLAILSQPLMPDAAARILAQLMVPEDARDFSHIHITAELKPETLLPKPEPIFPRIVSAEDATMDVSRT